MARGFFSIKDDLEGCTCDAGEECCLVISSSWPDPGEWCICGDCDYCNYCDKFAVTSLTDWWTSLVEDSRMSVDDESVWEQLLAEGDAL